MTLRQESVRITCAVMLLSQLFAFGADGAAPIATPIPPDCSIEQGADLSVSFFDYHPKQGPGIETLQQVAQYLAPREPVFCMPLTGGVIDFPLGEPHGIKSVETLGRFFYGRNADSNAVADVDAPERLSQSAGDRFLMVFRGVLTVDAPGIVHLSAPVDDAVEVRIGGLEVHRREPLGDLLPPDHVSSRFDVEFFEAGLYPVRLTYAQCEGYMGLRLLRGARATPDIELQWAPLVLSPRQP